MLAAALYLDQPFGIAMPSLTGTQVWRRPRDNSEPKAFSEKGHAEQGHQNDAQLVDRCNAPHYGSSPGSDPDGLSYFFPLRKLHRLSQDRDPVRRLQLNQQEH